MDIQRALLQRIKQNHRERFLVRRREHDECCNAGRERFTPGGGAHTPSIARLEAWKTEFRRRRNEVIPTPTREREKFFGYLHADDVQPNVLRSSVAAAVAIEAGSSTAPARRRARSCRRRA